MSLVRGCAVELSTVADSELLMAGAAAGLIRASEKSWMEGSMRCKIFVIRATETTAQAAPTHSTTANDLDTCDGPCTGILQARSINITHVGSEKNASQIKGVQMVRFCRQPVTLHAIVVVAVVVATILELFALANGAAVVTIYLAVVMFAMVVMVVAAGAAAVVAK